MNTNTINLANTQTQGPATSPVESSRESIDLSSPRRASAQALARSTKKEPELTNDKSALNTFNSAINGLKKLGSGAMWVATLGGAALSMASFFLLNIQTLGVVFAIPTLMSAYIAYNLSRTPKDAEVQPITKKAIDAVREAIDKPELLETHSNLVLQAVNEAMEKWNKNPDEIGIAKTLIELRDIIDKRKEQINVQDFKDDERNIAITRELDRFTLALQDLPEADELNEADASDSLD